MRIKGPLCVNIRAQDPPERLENLHPYIPTSALGRIGRFTCFFKESIKMDYLWPIVVDITILPYYNNLLPSIK